MAFINKLVSTSRRPLMAGLVIVAGATLGLTIAPHPANAATPRVITDTYKCNSSDRCGAGEATCCMDPDTDPDAQHCSTMCNGCNPAC